MEQTNNQSQTLYPMKQDEMPVPPGMGAPVPPNVPGIAGMAEGGLMDEGGSVDPVSGNDVPVGSLKEEVRDDIPAKLSEGEFVFPADVVRFIGLDRLMKMRQLAKDGLAKMEAMGQMGNADEATMEDDGDFESNIDGLLEEIEQEESSADNQTERMMAVGGSVENTEANNQNTNLVDSQPTMKPSEIIRQELIGQGLTEEEANAAIKNISTSVRINRAVMLQDNNSVFLGMPLQNETLKVHMFSADPEEKAKESIKKTMGYIKSAGVREVISSTNRPERVELVKDLGFETDIQDQNGIYRISIKVV
jgi:hypothetical protein